MTTEKRSGQRSAARGFYPAVTHEYLFYAIVAALCIGAYYARAAVSIGTVILGVIAFLAVIREGGLRRLLSSKHTLALMSVFLVFLLSGINSTNTQEWVSRLGDNLPFIAIPAGIWAFGPLSRKQVEIALGIFIGVTALSSLWVMGDYLLHAKEYNELYKVGKTIPTPIIHVRYSFFLALGAITAAGWLIQSPALVKGQRILLLAVGLWLVICVHILAVRTGIFALYGGLLSLGVLHVVNTRRWKVFAITFGAIVVLVAGSILLLPSVSNKIQYVVHDLNIMRDKGLNPEYSDNLRLTSIMHGMRIFLDHPVAGVGIGDVEDAMDALYASDEPAVPAERRFPPISQYVYWLAGLGLLGTSMVIGLLIYPLVQVGRSSYLLIGIYALTAFSFIGETSIQLQLGKTVFLLLVTILAAGSVESRNEEDAGAQTLPNATTSL